MKTQTNASLYLTIYFVKSKPELVHSLPVIRRRPKSIVSRLTFSRQGDTNSRFLTAYDLVAYSRFGLKSQEFFDSKIFQTLKNTVFLSCSILRISLLISFRFNRFQFNLYLVFKTLITVF